MIYPLEGAPSLIADFESSMTEYVWFLYEKCLDLYFKELNKLNYLPDEKWTSILFFPRWDLRADLRTKVEEHCSSSLLVSCWGSFSQIHPSRESAMWWWMRSMRETSTRICCWLCCAPAWRRTPTYDWFLWVLLGTSRGWPNTLEGVQLYKYQGSCTQWATNTWRTYWQRWDDHCQPLTM